MGLRETIRDYLAGDATLMALLPGGLYAGGEISRQDTPGAFDAYAEIRACGLVALEVQTPFGPFTNSMRQFFTVTFWQRSGYGAVDAALDETFVRLHESKAGEDDGVWRVLHVEDSQDLVDPGLACSMKYGRYQMVRAR
jgi:hypothetical protein